MTNPATKVRVRFLAMGFPVAMWYSFLGELQGKLHVGPAAWGFVLAISSVCSIVSMRVYAKIKSDRATESAANIALCALPVSAGLLLLCANFFLLIPLLVVYGACLGVSQVAASAIAHSTERNLGRAIFTSCHGYFSLGMLLAALTSTVFSELKSPSVVVALVTGISGIASYRVARTEGGLSENAEVESSVITQQPRSHPHIAIPVLVSIAIVVRVFDSAISAWHFSLTETDFRLNGWSGAVYAAYAAGGVMVRFGADFIRQRYGAFVTVAVIGPAAVIVMGATLRFGGIGLLLSAMVLLGGALGVTYPEILMVAASSDRSGARNGISWVLTGGTIGSLSASPFMGMMTQAFSTRSGFVLLDISLGVLVAYVIFIRLRMRSHSTRQVSTLSRGRQA